MSGKSKGRMCVVAGCSKRQTDDVSVHSFPKDERQRAAWTRFVKLTRADWTGPSQYTVICSEHFNEECYERQHFLMKDFGIPTKKRLVPGSVPSIYPKRKRDELNEAFIACPSPSLPAPTQERGAHAKRAKLRMLSELLQENNTPSSHHEIQQTYNDQEDPALEPEEVATSSIACQTPAPVKVGTRSMKIQVGAKMKEKGSQADMRPRVRSIGVQCNGTDIPPLSRPDREPARNEPLSSSEESSETDSDHGSVYEPSSTGSEESQIQDDQNDVHNPLEETKFIVSKSKLMELFSACRRCHRHAVDCVQHLVGTMVKIVAECQFCGFSWQWCSQPYLGSIPAGNLGLSAGILFSGALAAKVLRVLQCMGVATITQRTFSSHQSSILFPSVARVWDKHQRDYVRMAEERGEPLVLGGDGRADSPGHCAKYGSYSTIDLEQGIVVDIQLVQSNQVKNSNAMEKRGLELAVRWLQEHHLQIGIIITDRHLQIQKWIRENLPQTTHYYDVWHVAKGLKKKILAASKLKECEDISRWNKSLTNHLYWVAASTPDGDGDVMWAKWESVENHIHNVHEGHSDAFPTCAHETLDGDQRQKKWIKPETKASEKLSEIILSKQMQKDFPKLSPLHQTSQVEAFHSTINHFAPKMVSFSYHGMYCRLMIAALHFNENSSRPSATTKEGDLQYKISFPKFKHGDYSVRKKSVDPTYGYTSTLMQETLSAVKGASDEPVPCLPAVQPPPLCSGFIHPEKEDAILHFQSRFAGRETTV